MLALAALFLNLHAGDLQPLAEQVHNLTPVQFVELVRLSCNDERQLRDFATAFKTSYDKMFDGLQIESAQHPLAQIVLRHLYNDEVFFGSLLALNVSETYSYNWAEDPDFADEAYRNLVQGLVNAMLPIVTAYQEQKADKVTTEQQIAQNLAVRTVLETDRNHLAEQLNGANQQIANLATQRAAWNAEYTARLASLQQENTNRLGELGTQDAAAIANRDNLTTAFHDKENAIALKINDINIGQAHLADVIMAIGNTENDLRSKGHGLDIGLDANKHEGLDGPGSPGNPSA